MEAPDFGDRDDPSSRRRTERPVVWSVFVQAKVRAAPMIIGDVHREDAAKMRRVEDDDVIETLAANRSDHALNIRILPGTRRRGDDLGDAQAVATRRWNASP